MLDGPVISCDRLAEKITSTKGKTIDTWYSGKRGGFGSDIQAVMRPDGLPVWVSAGTAGSAHDLTAARTHLLGALSWAASQLRLPTLADGGYDGAKACLVAVAQPIVDHAGSCKQVLSASRPELIEVFTGLAPRTFRRLVAQVERPAAVQWPMG